MKTPKTHAEYVRRYEALWALAIKQPRMDAIKTLERCAQLKALWYGQ